MNSLSRYSSYETEIQTLFNQPHNIKLWKLISKDDPMLISIPEQGYTFMPYRFIRKKPRLKPYNLPSEINYGVLTKELLEVLLNRIPHENNGNQPYPFEGFEGLALCYGGKNKAEADCVFVSVYRHEGKKIFIDGVGSGGDNLTPTRIPKY
jgi:hypothetical protein